MEEKDLKRMSNMLNRDLYDDVLDTNLSQLLANMLKFCLSVLGILGMIEWRFVYKTIPEVMAGAAIATCGFLSLVYAVRIKVYWLETTRVRDSKWVFDLARTHKYNVGGLSDLYSVSTKGQIDTCMEEFKVWADENKLSEKDKKIGLSILKRRRRYLIKRHHSK